MKSHDHKVHNLKLWKSEMNEFGPGSNNDWYTFSKYNIFYGSRY